MKNLGNNGSKVARGHCASSAILAACLLAGCAGSEDHASEPVLAPSALFDTSLVADVRFDVDAAVWEDLRFQSPPVSQLAEGCDAGPPADAYTFFPARVQVNGTTLAQVGLRKKGFLGSISVVRPSLKVTFDEFVPEQRYGDFRRLTLNNNRQDPSRLRTCLAYGVFQRAGVEAPRCSLARVTVNGQDLGIYTNVEPVQKPFLLERFGNDEGNLYEGQVSDFTEADWRKFEAKTNKGETDYGDIQAAVAALGADDDTLLEQLDAVFDLDQALTFLAVEAVVGHIDGYSAQLNNFYVYNHPGSGKLRFVPWGPDTAFSHRSAVLPDDRPQAVFGQGILARRLFQHPEGRARYLTRLEEVLTSAWDEADLLRRIDDFEALLGERVAPDALVPVRQFIEARRAEIEAELAAPRAWEVPRVFECLDPPSVVSGEFDTVWDSLNSLDPKLSGALSLSISGEAQAFEVLATMAGDDTASDDAVLRLFGIRADGKTVVVQFGVESSQYADQASIPFHGFETFGAVGVLDDQLAFSPLGYITEGSLSFDQKSRSSGQPVRGRFNGHFYELPPGMLLGNRGQNNSP